MSEILDLPIIMWVIGVIAVIIPIVLITVTSFLKISITLQIFKMAVGANVPSAFLITIISLLISIHVSRPVFNDIYIAIDEENVISILSEENTSSTKLIKELQSMNLSKIIAPLNKFLRQNSDSNELQFFYEKQKNTSVLHQDDLNTFSLVSAYVLSELKAAFTIGVLIYLPFLIIDIVVSHILLGMGLMMMSPMTISMPLKLAVFVLCDGWMLLVSNLINSYQV